MRTSCASSRRGSLSDQSLGGEPGAVDIAVGEPPAGDDRERILEAVGEVLTLRREAIVAKALGEDRRRTARPRFGASGRVVGAALEAREVERSRASGRSPRVSESASRTASMSIPAATSAVRS